LTQEHRNAVARTAKSDMRRAVRVRIAAMTRQERDLADAAVCSHLVDLVLEVDAAFVVAYLALADEVRLDAFLSHIRGSGMRVLVPQVRTPGEISLAEWEPGCRLVPDLEGVPSPGTAAHWPDGRGLLVVPGRVFDTEGGRVGRGLGYYDRFLENARPHVAVAGVAYDCQVVERVPREPHDAGVEWLGTGTGRRRFLNR
jgi:5-formyltetrahydrofolate cyclo-ligase